MKIQWRKNFEISHSEVTKEVAIIVETGSYVSANIAWVTKFLT